MHSPILVWVRVVFVVGIGVWRCVPDVRECRQSKAANDIEPGDLSPHEDLLTVQV